MADEVAEAAVGNTASTQSVETVETAPREDRPAVDRPALEGRVADGLSKLFEDETPVDETAEASVETEEKKPETEVEPEVKEEPEATEKTDEEKVDESVAATTEKTAVPTLPAAYVRTLKAYDWTDAEIAEAAKNPAFVTTAAKMHTSRNAELAKWADMGRKTREADAAKNPQGQTAAVTTIAPIDAAALKKQYGDEPIIDAITGQMNKAIEQMNAMLPIVQETQAKAKQAELETLGRQIDGFFGGKDMTAYKDVYGLSSAKLAPEQIEKRNKVLETADAMMIGAQAQGRSLSLDSALMLAHDSVSSDVKEQAVRTELKSKVKQRERAITLKPSARTASPGAGAKVNTRSGLESKVKAGLAKAFG